MHFSSRAEFDVAEIKSMKNDHPTVAARKRFFTERNDLGHPFSMAAWRGCVLDRDKYTNARLPKDLWEALVNACDTFEIIICGYYSDCERCASISSCWDSYWRYVNDSANYSPDYVIFDNSNEWAILADVEVTTLGLSPELADLVDSFLAEHGGTSLLGLTRRDFSDQEILSAGGAYVRAVLGHSAVEYLQGSA